MILIEATSAAAGSGNPPLWMYVLIGVLPTVVAVVGYFLARRNDTKKREAKERLHQRELDRREDILWGYVDEQGVRHLGVVDVVGDLRKLMDNFKEEIDEALQSKGKSQGVIKRGPGSTS